YSPQIRAQRHLAISESRRSDLGRLMYERGVLRSQKLVTEFLREAMVSNKLIQADPVVATRHLYSLLESELLEPFLLQQLGEVSPEMIKTVTTRAIYVFMSAYGPRKMDERC
ncbi:MAG: TetR/AcrR family transcriptional regulator C-terminal domain-containing protein, partial [Burkholderiaceae bacterium]|nr:TetR/AcrR family transcriptional regulator C-terminal domain-containing protein [Burkholderiaceae bacterium]